MVDVQTISIAIASAGVFLAAIYYIFQIRHQSKTRQMGLLMNLYLTWGSDDIDRSKNKVWKKNKNSRLHDSFKDFRESLEVFHHKSAGRKQKKEGILRVMFSLYVDVSTCPGFKSDRSIERLR